MSVIESKLRPAHFLLVEDDDDHAFLVERAMTGNRIANTLARVPDGVEAIRYLRRETPYDEDPVPDVILLDLNLPKMNGHEVLDEIKSDPALKQIPVVVLTTSIAQDDRNRAYDARANSYLTKPVDFDQFHNMVQDLMLYWAVWNQSPQ